MFRKKQNKREMQTLAYTAATVLIDALTLFFPGAVFNCLANNVWNKNTTLSFKNYTDFHIAPQLKFSGFPKTRGFHCVLTLINCDMIVIDWQYILSLWKACVSANMAEYKLNTNLLHTTMGDYVRVRPLFQKETA